MMSDNERQITNIILLCILYSEDSVILVLKTDLFVQYLSLMPPDAVKETFGLHNTLMTRPR